jgi:hypothetical protein
LGFSGVVLTETGRPAYPAALLKINIYGYLNHLSVSIGMSLVPTSSGK